MDEIKATWFVKKKKKKVRPHFVLWSVILRDCERLNAKYFLVFFFVIVILLQGQWFSFQQIVSIQLYLFRTPASHTSVQCGSCTACQTEPGHFPLHYPCRKEADGPKQTCFFFFSWIHWSPKHWLCNCIFSFFFFFTVEQQRNYIYLSLSIWIHFLT